jgi:urease accessory protein
MTMWIARKTERLALSVMLACNAEAYGHSGEVHATDFISGVLHPLSGADHVLIMLAVGLWATLLGGGAVWLLPLGFTGVMLVGAVLCLHGWTLPAPELCIALSLVGMGSVLLGGWKPNIVPALTMVGAFALYHGFVHAQEMAESSGLASYGGGFLLTTLLLHAVGLMLGRSVNERAPLRLFRTFGIACTGVGAYLLAG